MGIPLVFDFVNIDEQILMGEICMFHSHKNNEFQVGSLYHLVNTRLECLYQPGDLDHKDG